MRIENISKYLVEGADLTDLSESDIKSLIQASPFSTALRHLLVKKQSLNQNFILDDMSQAAYHSPHVDQFHAQHFKCEAIDTSISSDVDQKIDPSKSSSIAAASAIVAGTAAVASVKSSTDSQGAVEDTQVETETSSEQIIPTQVQPKQTITGEEPKANKETDDEKKEPQMKFAHLSDYAKWLMSTTSIVDIDQAQKASINQISPVDTIQSNTEVIEIQEDEEVSLQVEDKSMEYNEQIVSESLAELLVEQGLKNKAIAMYEKLSLIIPEKRAYFAVQIKKIK